MKPITAFSKAKQTADQLSVEGAINGYALIYNESLQKFEPKPLPEGSMTGSLVQGSATNGKIVIDGVETPVYTHPSTHSISEVSGLQAELDKTGNRSSALTNNTYVSLSQWLNDIEDQANIKFNVKNKKYGAIGDGARHAVYPTYTTKAALQIKYPQLTDAYLTSVGVDPTTTAWQSLEIDWCAIQSCLLDNKVAYVPKGTYAITIALDVGSGRLVGEGRSVSIINQYTNAEAVIKVKSVPYVADVWLAHFGLPSDQTVPNGVGILTTGSVNDGAVFERLYIRSVTSGFFNSDTDGFHVYSTHFRDIRITRFTHSAMYFGGDGHTGNVLVNIYAVNWNNTPYVDGKIASTYGYVFKGMSEGVFEQLNLEHGLYGKGIVISGSGNMSFNGVHFEGYEPNLNLGSFFAVDGSGTTASINNATIVFSNFDSAKAPSYAFLTLGGTANVVVDGVWERDNTITGSPTLRKYYGDGTIAEPAYVKSRRFRMLANLFNASDYFPVTPIQPFVREHNDIRYYWEEAGKRRFTGSAMPTSGSYNAGDEVVNTNKTEQGTAGSKYVIEKWMRLTTGSSHVLGTDWITLRLLTGN